MIASTRYDNRIAAYQQRNSKRYRDAKGPVTLHEAIQIAKAEWRGRHLSGSTLTAYLSDLKEFSAFAHKVWSHPCYFHEIDKFKCADYHSYLYSHEEWKGTTLQGKIDSLSALFKVLVPLGYAHVNPMHLIETGEDRRRRVPNRLEEECPVSIEDISRLLSLDFGDKWGLRYILKKYRDKLGLEQLRPKDFRTLLLSMISKQWDPRTVQAFIGHLTPETANKFYERRTRTEIQSVLNIWIDAIEAGLSIDDMDHADEEELAA